ncbi:LysR family transcriptional regulator [Streptomyces spectabilis]|uniref:DNA-binding transcriptional LysR family regulator n=1 Tax=Streptomyces spectabilis TaxID=68270 RepID=A0A5P2X2W5_STRST|nr:LysR family transcriptional regulator [Streptomyces spectabilis]UUW33137.1 helix-turn-helix LysR family protein [Streptomyces sp.]MBB5101290.1 DNA-binding transcriptional LysR family regulator [Streptomyces spectabilis]MCI3900489.1 LysR family transcriptional regulator [Streptomyces spectabilis]QEV58064.1 LysR family transcriptional regulator [Streptomyces spectabilis]GGV10414.1 LysR family transcriptional regulator [Streptomyces spectabilis]
MLDVRRLHLLRELDRRGTIAAVAEALTFTASAVSQQLGVLEREAGVPLLERSGRRVVLTPAGRTLVTHADAVLERLELAVSELASAREGVGGPLRIGTFPSGGHTIVAAALAELARRHPALEPMVREIDSARVSDGLRAGELDVALVHDYDFVPASPDVTVDEIPLVDEPMYLVTHAGAPAGGRGATLAELLGPYAEAPWITARDGTTGHAMAVRACQAAGFQPRIRHQVNDFRTVLALAATGQGAGFVPETATTHGPSGVLLTELPLFRRSKVAFRAGGGSHPAIAAFVTAARAVVGGTAGEPQE